MRIPIDSGTSFRGRNSRPNWLVLAAFIGAIVLSLVNMMLKWLVHPAREGD